MQSDWMANEKTKKSLAAILHACAYACSFVFLRPTWPGLAFIIVSHFVIDRWRLARFLVYVKNYLAPKANWSPWQDCSATGYHKDRPAWMAVWLLILADNTLHLLCNGFAFKYL